MKKLRILSVMLLSLVIAAGLTFSFAFAEGGGEDEASIDSISAQRGEAVHLTFNFSSPDPDDDYSEFLDSDAYAIALGIDGDESEVADLGTPLSEDQYAVDREKGTVEVTFDESTTMDFSLGEHRVKLNVLRIGDGVTVSNMSQTFYIIPTVTVYANGGLVSYKGGAPTDSVAISLKEYLGIVHSDEYAWSTPYGDRFLENFVFSNSDTHKVFEGKLARDPEGKEEVPYENNIAEDEDLTLYAIWETVENPVSVTLHPNGLEVQNQIGLYATEPTTYIVERGKAFPLPGLNGWSDGWYDNAEFSGRALSVRSFVPTQDMDIYAKAISEDEWGKLPTHDSLTIDLSCLNIELDGSMPENRSMRIASEDGYDIYFYRIVPGTNSEDSRIYHAGGRYWAYFRVDCNSGRLPDDMKNAIEIVNAESESCTVKIVSTNVNPSYSGNYPAKIVTVDFSLSTDASIPGESVTLSSSLFTYDGTAKEPAVEVKDSSGKTLAQNVDYTVAYKNNVAAGTAKVTITGMGSYEGVVEKTFKINPTSLHSASLSKATFAYTGKVIVPGVTVKGIGKAALKSGSDFAVSYKDNVKVGTATVTIRGKGNYSGAITKTFVINPAKVKITKLKRGKKSLVVKWSKGNSQVEGYQVRYSKSSKMSKAKTVLVKGANNASKKLKKLAGKKKYYVQVRTYKKVGKKTYYSDWSSAKSAKTK